MKKVKSKFNTFRILYNKSYKTCMNINKNAQHSKIDKLMGVQSARNIVYSSYVRNYKLWEKEFLNYKTVTKNKE